MATKYNAICSLCYTSIKNPYMRKIWSDTCCNFAETGGWLEFQHNDFVKRHLYELEIRDFIVSHEDLDSFYAIPFDVFETPEYEMFFCRGH